MKSVSRNAWSGVGWLVLTGLVGVGVFAISILLAQKPLPNPECLDKVLHLKMTTGEITCSHQDHVLQFGNRDGTVWLCICDVKGAAARRAKP